MANKKIIAVVGATGAQGGGLARAILADPAGGFAARALTRKPDSENARELAARGAPRSWPATSTTRSRSKKAFAGAHGAYCVTNYWEHFSTERELAQARRWPRPRRRRASNHVIWSTLEDTRKWVPLSDDRMPTLMGRYKVPHFDSKGEADQRLHRRRRADDVPADVLLLGQLHRLRHGAEEGAGRPPRAHASDGRQEAAVDRRRGHRPLRVRHLPEGRRSSSARRSASRAST